MSPSLLAVDANVLLRLYEELDLALDCFYPFKDENHSSVAMRCCVVPLVHRQGAGDTAAEAA